jgi:large subunit ribosomal protein L17
MRHLVRGRKLNRTSAHRLALRRNMCQSLFEHGEIRTTVPKAKEVRALAERLVRMAVDAAAALGRNDKIAALGLRQRVIAMLNDRAIIASENQEEYDRLSDAKRERVLKSRSGRNYRASTTKPGVKFTAESVIHKLFATIGPQMLKRDTARNCRGGYTRVITLADRRLGDGGQLAILQLVGQEEEPRPKNTDKTERKRKATVRYAAYAGKALPQRRPRRATKGAPAEGAAKSAGAGAAPTEGAAAKPAEGAAQE